MVEHVISHAFAGEIPSPVHERVSVRAVVRREDRLLMLHSRRDGDYSFPGGGIDAGETVGEALAREVREEAGRRLVSFGAEIVRVAELREARDPGYAAFRLLSRYFLCEVGDDILEQELEAYEAEMQLVPVWVSLEEALRTDRELYADPATRRLYHRREILALEEVQTLMRKTCPLCGRPNACRHGDAECWCTDLEFPRGLLARIPAGLVNKACVCRDCVEAYLRTQPDALA